MMRRSVEKWILISLVVLVPVLFVANVRQSYRFWQIEQEVVRVQAQHSRVLEENKQLLVGISGLRSPARIRFLASEELGLDALGETRIIRIKPGGGGVVR
jgi:cell division protein FtsL